MRNLLLEVLPGITEIGSHVRVDIALHVKRKLHRVVTQFKPFAEHEVGMMNHIRLGHIHRALFETSVRELGPSLGIDFGKTQIHETHCGIEETEFQKPVFRITDFENGEFVTQSPVGSGSDRTTTCTNGDSFCSESGYFSCEGLSHERMDP